MREGEFDRVLGRNQIEADEGDIICDMGTSDFPGDRGDTWDVDKIPDGEPEQGEMPEPKARGKQFKIKEGDREDMTRAAPRGN